ncbi:MAG: hypothetical protein RL463_936, partial [Bacteroidota bacterium]
MNLEQAEATWFPGRTTILAS